MRSTGKGSDAPHPRRRLETAYVEVHEDADVGMAMVGGAFSAEDFLAEFDHLTTYGDDFNFHLTSGDIIDIDTQYKCCLLISKSEALELSDLVDL